MPHQQPQGLAQGLARYDATYSEEFRSAFAAKFGFAVWREADAALIEEGFGLMHRAEVDMTLFFQNLAHMPGEKPDPIHLLEAFYSEELFDRHKDEFQAWLSRWAARVREEEARKAEQADKPRPRIGVKIDTVGRYLPASQGIVPQGAFIAEVEENSPAQAAGLKVGDIIVEADGEIITTQTQLIEKLQTLKEGDYVQLKVYRVTGLLDALQNTSKLSELGKGEYLDIKVQLLILDKMNM